MQGKTINGFELKRQLGVGGMAEVWYAENEIGKPAAVKILNEDLSNNAQIVERFRNEAVVMVKLNHPNIRQVYGYGTIDDRPAIIMEYLDGDDLKARLKRGQCFTDKELEKWWNQLADALNYTHRQGIVHRDIKPGNIFVDNDGNIKLLDFGIAKIRESISSTQTGQKLGTLMYMSPEQVKDSKHVDHRTDLYSLAVTFVHLLTGKAPYDSETSSDFEISEQIVYKPLDMSLVPQEWRGFLTSYLEKDPARRPALHRFDIGVSRRPFESTFPIDDGTISETVPSSFSGSSMGESMPPSWSNEGSNASPKSKSKKGLWIALAAVAVAVLVAVLVSVLSTGHRNSIVRNQGSSEGRASSQGNDWTKDVSIQVNGMSIVMKPVMGGTFQMGSNDYEAAGDEQPVHSVTVNSFYICETEVTQALWEAVMGTTIYQQRDLAFASSSGQGNLPLRGVGGNYPMYYVNWYECQDFIRKLNQRTGKHFRLPTEAEWEFAARGGNLGNGFKYAGGSIGSVAWYAENSDVSCHPVKGKAPNELRLYDMSGNVWEWCSDGYGSSYYNYSQSNNPQGDSGTNRVLRGGSWYSQSSYCRVSKRHNLSPYYRDTCYGFRLVMDL